MADCAATRNRGHRKRGLLLLSRRNRFSRDVFHTLGSCSRAVLLQSFVFPVSPFFSLSLCFVLPFDRLVRHLGKSLTLGESRRAQVLHPCQRGAEGGVGQAVSERKGDLSARWLNRGMDTNRHGFGTLSPEPFFVLGFMGKNFEV